MIKAVLFDYDGVLTTDKTGSVTTHRYLSEKTASASRCFAMLSARTTAT